jgi:uncharacterized protein DUF4349
MRRLDETPIDPEVAASLDAIDATLAGEPVDPRHAELAELALLLAAERPEPDQAFAHSLDQRVSRRFAASPPAAETLSPRRRRWLAPAAGLGSAALAAIVAVVVLAGGPGGSRPASVTVGVAASSSGSAPPTISQPASGAAPSRAAKVPVPAAPVGEALSSTASGSSGAVLQPPPNGRKVIQGAQLSLTTAPSRIELVAQEVFDVIGQENGIVNSSTVTAASAPGAYAEFQLSVPSSALAQTMSALSSLRYAHVASRTDTTQDVNDQYQTDVRRLADARALRTSLLKQLANATTQTQIDSLTAQIHDAEASISSDEATLRQLDRQVNFSQVSLTINSPVPVPLPAQSGSSGFTLGKAAHDAGRVLTVAAGVALIGLAALVPVALLGALAWWVAASLRRRRREQVLDTV